MKRARGQHGAQPLSVNTRRRVLTRLLEKAEAGDLAAAEVLVRLSLEEERTRRGSGRGHVAVPASALAETN